MLELSFVLPNDIWRSPYMYLPTKIRFELHHFLRYFLLSVYRLPKSKKFTQWSCIHMIRYGRLHLYAGIQVVYSWKFKSSGDCATSFMNYVCYVFAMVGKSDQILWAIWCETNTINTYHIIECYTIMAVFISVAELSGTGEEDVMYRTILAGTIYCLETPQHCQHHLLLNLTTDFYDCFHTTSTIIIPIERALIIIAISSAYSYLKHINEYIYRNILNNVEHWEMSWYSRSVGFLLLILQRLLQPPQFSYEYNKSTKYCDLITLIWSLMFFFPANFITSWTHLICFDDYYFCYDFS